MQKSYQVIYMSGICHLHGRNFPVEMRYVPSDYGDHFGSAAVETYVVDVVKMASEIHKTDKEGIILAFMTSHVEVEWACEKFKVSFVVALPLHGKLISEELFHIFHNYTGKREMIFSTNLAETRITIPCLKYVIDSEFVKDCRFYPCTGMNVLEVCWIIRSSLNQSDGCARRTESGRCYRLYSEVYFHPMELIQEPDIQRVHLGVAHLKIHVLGVKNLQDFDFVDALRPSFIEMAIKNLIQLGFIKLNNDVHELTYEGRYLARVGIEPTHNKLILGGFQLAMGKEGVVLAAVIPHASNIFCRFGCEVVET